MDTISDYARTKKERKFYVQKSGRNCEKIVLDNFNDFTLIYLFSKTVGSKRARLSAETDHDTGSESPSSPKHKSFSLPLSVSPTHNHSPSSPESDLDVDSAPDEVAPENLSLKKKERSKSPVTNNNLHNNLGFLPYQQSFHQPNVSTSPNQRSPVDVLSRFV